MFERKVSKIKWYRMMERQVILKEGSSLHFSVLILINMCCMISIKQDVLERKKKQIHIYLCIDRGMQHISLSSLIQNFSKKANSVRYFHRDRWIMNSWSRKFRKHWNKWNSMSFSGIFRAFQVLMLWQVPSIGYGAKWSLILFNHATPCRFGRREPGETLVFPGKATEVFWASEYMF